MKLTIDNSMCSLSDLTKDQFSEIRDILSYTEEVMNRFAGRQYVTKYLIDKRGMFPSGLYPKVKAWAKKKNYNLIISDKRKVPKNHSGMFNLDLGPIKPYPEQTEASEIVTKIHRGTIRATTGFGKSITMALLVQKLQVRTLIIVPNLNLKQQLTADFLKYFGKLDNITIQNIDASSLIKETDYDCLIIDEAHHSSSMTYRVLNKKAWNKIYYRYFFTATPFRAKSEEQLLLESIAGQVVYEVPYHQAVNNGYIVPLEAYYYTLPKIRIKGNTKSWPAMYSELIVGREDRNNLIAEIASNLDENNISTLVLVKQIEHGNSLQTKIGHNKASFMKGENDNNRMLLLEFLLREKNIMIGTLGVLGEGVDSKPAEFVIIAGLGKSKPQFMQNCGRVFRRYDGKESGKVILFLDPSHKWTVEHFNSQVEYLKEEYGVIPVELPFPDHLLNEQK